MLCGLCGVLLVSRRKNRRHAALFAADDFPFHARAGGEEVIGDFVAGRGVLHQAVFAAGQFGVIREDNTVALLVVDRGKRTRMHPLVDPLFVVALFAHFHGSPRDRNRAVAFRRHFKREFVAQNLKRSLMHFNGPGIDRCLRHFVARKVLGVDFDGLGAVGRFRPRGLRGEKRAAKQG